MWLLRLLNNVWMLWCLWSKKHKKQTIQCNNIMQCILVSKTKGGTWVGKACIISLQKSLDFCFLFFPLYDDDIFSVFHHIYKRSWFHITFAKNITHNPFTLAKTDQKNISILTVIFRNNSELVPAQHMWIFWLLRIGIILWSNIALIFGKHPITNIIQFGIRRLLMWSLHLVDTFTRQSTRYYDNFTLGTDLG